MSRPAETELVTDGGCPPNLRTSDRGWPDDAVENMLRWGEQPAIDLVLAVVEEVGELADEVLNSACFDTPEAKHARVCLSAARDAGFVTRSFLEYSFEDDNGEPLPPDERPELGHGVDADAVLDELDDLAPLCYQLARALDEPSPLPVTDGGQEPMAVYTVSNGDDSPRLTIHQKALEPAGFEPDDQVLVYASDGELRLEAVSGRVLRDADGDPVVVDELVADGEGGRR